MPAGLAPALLIALCTLALAAPLPAAEPSPPDLKPLRAAVEKLVTRHYSKAKVALVEGVIHFEYNTRKFLVHEQTSRGEWQDAVEEVGPNKGGILGKISFQPGEYLGMADVPLSFDKHYFIVRLSAPYSKKLDGHLYIHLKHPRNAPAEFVKDFEALVSEFEEYVGETK